MARSSGSIFIFLLFATSAWGQANDSTIVKKELPKEKHSFLPTGIRLGTDLISLIRTQTDESFRGYEFNADVDFYRYYLTVEAGHWERYFTPDGEVYTSDGNYLRIGVDVNFLLKDPDKNMF